MIALTREVSPKLGDCELTHLTRAPIDVPLARQQHAAYERALAELGCEVVRIPAAPDLPDSVFVEDLAVVVDEIAVLTRPGAATRRPEGDGVAGSLAAYRECVTIDSPGTLDGGDVLVSGRDVYVGRSRRTNDEGIRQLAGHLGPRGYAVHPVPVQGCLHLKSAVTLVGERRLLLQARWADPSDFAGHDVVETDPSEPGAANALRLGGAAIYPSAFPRTRARLEKLGLRVVEVDVSEIAKAEGGVTCCSLLLAS
jgi:dimethylargininase